MKLNATDLDPKLLLKPPLPRHGHTENEFSYVCCDYNYLKKWHKVLNTSPLRAGLIRLTCIYVSSHSELKLAKDFLRTDSEQWAAKGIYFSLYNQPVLDQYCRSLSPEHAALTRINYIRCSRFKLAPLLQEYLSTSIPELSLHRFFYILDADHIPLMPIRDAIRKENINKDSSILLGWNSAFFKDHQYPDRRTSNYVSQPSDRPEYPYTHGKSYITVKAGFMALSPASSSAKLFAQMLTDYAIGPPGSMGLRMFNFYYGDQLAIHLTADDLAKNLGASWYAKHISFVDMATSRICSLDLSSDAAILMPKGISVAQLIKQCGHLL